MHVVTKKKEIEKSIKRQHWLVVVAADKARDEALAALCGVAHQVETDCSQKCTYNSEDLTTLKEAQAKLRDVGDKSMEDMIHIANSLDLNVLMPQASFQETLQEKYMANKRALDSWTVVHRLSDKGSDVGSIAAQCRILIGDAQRMTLPSGDGGTSMMRLVHSFEVKTPHAFISSICHVDSDPERIYVWYDSVGLGQKPQVQQFEFRAAVWVASSMAEAKFGRCSRRRYDKGKSMGISSLADTNLNVTFCKSLTAGHFSLVRSSSGAIFSRTYILNLNPLNTQVVPYFRVTVTHHRAMDVDNSETLFVVVEEAVPPLIHRKVCLYRHPGPDAVATYTSPVKPFQPADVCFYILEGRQLLLVADEASDAIHVVQVTETSMTFLHFLDTGVPSLVRPTALNVDILGRLWVGCGLGQVLALTPTGPTSS
jgi:hypothetical protein